MKILCRILEIARWACVVVGFQLASQKGGTPAEQLSVLAPWVVIPLAGFTGIESVFLTKYASEVSGYAYSPYQRQSGMNNLALAIAAVLATALKWGTYAEVALLTVLLIFLTMSACNHLWSAVKEGNRSVQNFLRPILTALLLVFIIPYILRALR